MTQFSLKMQNFCWNKRPNVAGLSQRGAGERGSASWRGTSVPKTLTPGFSDPGDASAAPRSTFWPRRRTLTAKQV